MGTSAETGIPDALLSSLGISKFLVASDHQLRNAQRNLAGRTHYVDGGTIGFFRARIIRSSVAHAGLTFWLVESVGNRPDPSSGRFRFVAFDVSGNAMTDSDCWHRTSKAATKAAYAWLEAHDALAATLAVLDRRLQAAKQEVHAIDKFLSGRPQ